GAHPPASVTGIRVPRKLGRGTACVRRARRRNRTVAPPYTNAPRHWLPCPALHDEDPMAQDAPAAAGIGDQIAAVIAELPDGPVTLGLVMDRLGQDSLLLLTVLLTLVFLIPVSIPGVSTVFGAAIRLVGVARLAGRARWRPARLRARELPGARLRAALEGGLRWVRRLETLSRPRRLPALAVAPAAMLFNHLAF